MLRAFANRAVGQESLLRGHRHPARCGDWGKGRPAETPGVPTGRMPVLPQTRRQLVVLRGQFFRDIFA